MSLRAARIRLARVALVLALSSSAAALPQVDGRFATAAAIGALGHPAPIAAARSRPRASGRQPLVFVVHPTHAPIDLSWNAAYALVTGTSRGWKTLDGRDRPVHLILGPAAAARAGGLWLLLGRVPTPLVLARSETDAAEEVSRDPDALGVIAAEALSPAVRTVTLGGADPLRAPAEYPLTVPGAVPGPVITAIAFGDVMTSRTVDAKMRAHGSFASPWVYVSSTLAAQDLAFGNFEGTISYHALPLPGGTRFVSRPQVIEGFRSAGLDFLSVANNHIGDFGSGTLRETVDLLRGAGIAVAGAGADLAGASEPAIVERHGVRFAFVSFNAIVGTPPAAENSAGAVRIEMAPWFPFSDQALAAVVEDVKRARAMADVVIVYPHWGKEYTAHPNADQIRVAHALIDAGADMLIATHPHWVQGAEIYKGHLIAYSLGNFVFDQTWSVETQQGAAIRLTFWGKRLVGASFVPVEIEDAHRPRFVSDAAGREILERIWGASGEPYRRGS